MLYSIAQRIWNIAKWVWLVIIIPIALDLVKNGIEANKPEVMLSQSFLFGPVYRIPVLLVLGVFFAITLTARGIIVVEESRRGSKGALKKYLRDVADKNRDLKPAGFAQQSALISVSVPLDEVFIQLRVVSDRPRYDMPTEQMKLLEALRQRSDLSPEQREEQLQALRVIWYSQIGREWLESQQTRDVDMTDVLRQLTAEQPGAVILGAPGSGKSTTMRWFAYHMAHACRLSRFHRWFNALSRLLSRLTRTSLAWGYHLPEGVALSRSPS